MGRRLQITFTDEQYAWLTRESERTSISAAEYVRRALEEAYDLRGTPRKDGFEVRFGVRLRGDETGRRPGKRLN
jgi:Ribbon-helix-helix domain